ncbi:putative UPF0481 protein, partial [Mucuna pruriens]
MPIVDNCDRQGEKNSPNLEKFIRSQANSSECAWSNPTATIVPSEKEFRKFGIHFQPAEGSISSIKFNRGKFKFCLPRIRLDAISEVIIRNLVTYESLTKFNGLIFTCYIELMSSLIHTDEDVNVFLRAEIIQIHLSAEVVAQFFYDMRKMIKWPTKIPDLEQEITKVNAELHRFKDIVSLLMDIVRPAMNFLIFILILGTICIKTIAVKPTYCNHYPTAKICKPPKVWNYDPNNFFIIFTPHPITFSTLKRPSQPPLETISPPLETISPPSRRLLVKELKILWDKGVDVLDEFDNLNFKICTILPKYEDKSEMWKINATKSKTFGLKDEATKDLNSHRSQLQFDLKIEKVSPRNRKAKKDMTENHEDRRNYDEDPSKRTLQVYFILAIEVDKDHAFPSQARYLLGSHTKGSSHEVQLSLNGCTLSLSELEPQLALYALLPNETPPLLSELRL